MKIGIDARCFARGKITGVEEYTKNMLESIFDSDHTNSYILFFNAWKNQDVDFAWATQYANVSVKKFAIPNKLLNFCLWFFRYPKLDRLLGGVDVFFMPNNNFCAVSPNVDLLLTVHDLSFEHYKKTFSLKRQVWHFFVNPRLLMNRANHIFAVSEATKIDLCTTYHIASQKVTVMLNGKPSHMGTLSRNDLSLITVKEKYKLPYKFILYFGTIEPRKNIVSIIKAFDILRKKNPQIPHKLVIAGSRGWRSVAIYTEKELAKYHADIMIIADIPEEDKEALYTLASVFVYPSFFEGFGFPPLEAMMCGTPVITSHTSSLPEVGGSQCIMIDPHRQEELVIALEALLDDHVAVQSFFDSQKIVRYINKFNWRSSGDMFYQYVSSLNK